MLFPTATFAVFFVIVFAASWSLRENVEIRKAALLVASYVFYGWWDWRFCFLLAFASCVAWSSALARQHVETDAAKKWSTRASIIALLGVLGFFKYYGFFLSSLQELLFSLGLQRDLPFLEIILPVGISFFSFQAISYVVDCARGSVVARRNPIDVFLYISFFPQLVAGPIVRAADFIPQMAQRNSLNGGMIAFGLVLCASGLFKKMVIANYLAADLVDPVFLDPGSYSALIIVLATYGYAVQIYCDFSGYSDIAIGTAALLGFRFLKNFDQPYRATSLRDFWRRWHISLSGWLRDYLYIPLGGSRLGTMKTYRNLFLTMFLGGLWHGAAWNFLIWGSLHGGWLALERALTGQGGAPGGSRVRAILGWLVTFNIVCVAWVFFRAASFEDAMMAFSQLGDYGSNGMELLTWFTLALVVLPLAFQFAPQDGNEKIAKILAMRSTLSIFMLFCAALLIILWLAPAGTAPFIYFQF